MPGRKDITDHPLQQRHSAGNSLDAIFKSAVGVGSVIVIGSIGSLAWNGKDTCMEFLSLETVCNMQLLYMGGGCIVLGCIVKKINIYYFPPLKPTADPAPAVKKKKPLILGSNIKTRAVQSIRQQKSQKQPHFWREKSKAVINSITACCSHIFTQCSILATDSQHWLTQSRSTLSSALAWGQSKFSSKTNRDTLPDSTSLHKSKKKPRRKKTSNSLKSTSTTSILQSIYPVTPTNEDSRDSTSEENKDFPTLPPTSTISTSVSNT